VISVSSEEDEKPVLPSLSTLGTMDLPLVATPVPEGDPSDTPVSESELARITAEVNLAVQRQEELQAKQETSEDNQMAPSTQQEDIERSPEQEMAELAAKTEQVNLSASPVTTTRFPVTILSITPVAATPSVPTEAPMETPSASIDMPPTQEGKEEGEVTSDEAD
jgi:hypothetical protein